MESLKMFILTEKNSSHICAQSLASHQMRITIICDALRDLVPFVQFKSTHGGVLLLVTLQVLPYT